ncbi:hypothetical protein Tco_0885644 [Tanacetum coccineum]
MVLSQPWQMYPLSSTAYISEPHFILQFVESEIVRILAGQIAICGLVKVADKSEIVRILAGQIGKFAAMADASSFFRLQGCAGGHRVARTFGFAAMADVIIGLCLNKGES